MINFVRTKKGDNFGPSQLSVRKPPGAGQLCLLLYSLPSVTGIVNIYYDHHNTGHTDWAAAGTQETRLQILSSAVATVQSCFSQGRLKSSVHIKGIYLGQKIISKCDTRSSSNKQKNQKNWPKCVSGHLSRFRHK